MCGIGNGFQCVYHNMHFLFPYPSIHPSKALTHTFTLILTASIHSSPSLPPLPLSNLRNFIQTSEHRLTRLISHQTPPTSPAYVYREVLKQSSAHSHPLKLRSRNLNAKCQPTSQPASHIASPTQDHSQLSLQTLAAAYNKDTICLNVFRAIDFFCLFHCVCFSTATQSALLRVSVLCWSAATQGNTEKNDEVVMRLPDVPRNTCHSFLLRYNIIFVVFAEREA